MRALILIAGAALAVAACSPSETPANYTNYVSGAETDTDCGLASNTVKDEQALFAAETAYNIPADTYVRLSATNKLTPEIKAAVQPKLVKLYDLLKLARAAYKAGDGCSLKNYSDLADKLGVEVKVQLPNL